MFDSLVNVTDPTAHMGQRRGVLSGGSVSPATGS
jgi:conjugative transfer pilus assembly protein TraH